MTTAGRETLQFGVVSNPMGFVGFIEALKQEDMLKVLAEPNLVTVSGRPASYLVGGQMPYPQPTGFGNIAINFRDFGTQIDFVPTKTRSAKSSNNNEPITNNYAAIVRAALDDSIERHFVSDVPVGVFLSGGIDSTSIVALASKKTKEPLRTFSISFDDPVFNEGGVAAKTAAHFGTQHTDWRLDAATAKGLLSDFLEKSDQPSIDGFNTFCVAKMAHDHGLKVVLSGLGGDEVFGGYRSFELIPGMMRASRRINSLSIMRSFGGRSYGTIGDSPACASPGLFSAGYTNGRFSLLVYAGNIYSARSEPTASTLRRRWEKWHDTI